MILYFTLFSLFLFSLLFIIMAPVRINIKYLRENNKEKIRIKLILFWGLVKFNLPSLRRPKGSQKNNKKTKAQAFSLKALTDLIFLLREMRNIVICDKFYWTTAFGLPDAAQTGVLSGIIWGIKGNILAVIKWFFIFEDRDPEIEVRPDFKNAHLLVEIKSSFRFYPYRLLKAGIKIVYQKVRGGAFNWKIIQSRV
ncbi:DUF2953 domain-containing protein [Candidatus Contubernalis alkaliaceticus]|uniref:DUF2953 domain-containing protein n=1 Tax=Candidatus Contubernalis alkaliaceticus TaxID=338645 RepID=UPI001F4BFB24|nr:DUF2953 domain-containing protein [Candidatus Contubernalis alkalaceticus]UNC92508.1 DUF2953 domain-containing protein [Candidatus Contubernalis alkalaceticus]